MLLMLQFGQQHKQESSGKAASAGVLGYANVTKLLRTLELLVYLSSTTVFSTW